MNRHFRMSNVKSETYIIIYIIRKIKNNDRTLVRRTHAPCITTEDIIDCDTKFTIIIIMTRLTATIIQFGTGFLFFRGT